MADQPAITASQAQAGARLIAAARVGLGVTAALAPRLSGRLLLGDRDGASQVAVRMLGGRDVALGLGALLAARRRGPGALRGWVEAGLLADAVDALAFAAGRRVRPSLRVLTVLVAGGAAAVSAVLARRLGGDDVTA